ncbi:unnamed protein product, partial [Bubo scandiacus]
MASGCTVRQCLPRPYILVVLMCQAIGSTPSSKSDYPFPPPGWRQGPSNPAHHHSLDLRVTPARMTSWSPQEGQAYSQMGLPLCCQLVFFHSCSHPHRALATIQESV